MSSKSQNKRITRTIIASTLGLTLVLGGSTYALWSTNSEVASNATITAGDLQVRAISKPTWVDITNPDTPLELSTLKGFFMVPGDKIKLAQSLSVVVVGDNISGTLETLIPNETLSDPLMRQANFTLALLDKNGVELGSYTSETNSTNSLALTVEDLKQTAPEGEAYTIELIVELPETSDNGTKLSTAVLNKMSLILKQGSALAPQFVADSNLGTLMLEPTTSRIQLLDPKEKGVTLSLDSGRLPSGMELTTNALEGVPDEVGTFKFGISAKAANKTTVKNFTLKVDITGIEGWQTITVNGEPHKFTNAQVSSDGTRMMAVDGSTIFVSYNGGLTWGEMGYGSPLTAMSSNGAYIYSDANRFSYFKLGSTFDPTAWTIRNSGTSKPGSNAYKVAVDDFGKTYSFQKNSFIYYGTGTSWSFFTNTGNSTSGDITENGVIVSNAGYSNGLTVTINNYNGTASQLGGPAGSKYTIVQTGTLSARIATVRPNGDIYVGYASKNPSGAFLNLGLNQTASGTGVWDDFQLSGTTLIGLQDGRVKKSIDNGVTWADITPTQLPVKMMHIPSTSNNLIMLTVDGGDQDYILQGRF